jgi:hypothetical protein
MALASVFAGLAVLVAVLAFTHQLFLLLLAVPLGATAYFMWYQATGRLEARTRRRVRRGEDRDRAGFGAGARRANASANRRRAAAGRTGSTRRSQSGLSRTQAYRTLDLQPGASREEVKRAYRAKVKTVHPDTKTGDEESFKRVNRAYELLSE